jgi:hypothetical protein
VRVRPAIAGIALLALAGCSSVDKPATPPPHVVKHQPPSRKDVIGAVLASQSLSLTVHSSCKGVGTDRADTTIGEYLSGFLAEFASGGRNWLDTNVAEAQGDDSAPVWRAELIVRHADSEDEWGWGVRFDVRRDTGVVDPSSFRCIGAG